MFQFFWRPLCKLRIWKDAFEYAIILWTIFITVGSFMVIYVMTWKDLNQSHLRKFYVPKKALWVIFDYYHVCSYSYSYCSFKSYSYSYYQSYSYSNLLILLLAYVQYEDSCYSAPRLEEAAADHNLLDIFHLAGNLCFEVKPFAEFRF